MTNDYSPNTKLTDKSIICQDCGEPFVFTAGEQQYFLDKDLAFPKRCRRCRNLRKLNIMPNVGGK